MVDRIRIDGGGFVVDQSPGDTVLRAALRAGLGFPYECNSGGCGSCKFDLIEGQIECLWPEAPGLTERDRKRGRHLACQCRAVDEVTIKVRLGEEYKSRVAPRRRVARLVATAAVTHDLREFCFATDEPADFLPGQFASLTLPGVSSARAYSMSNLPNAAGDWHFQIRRVPAGRGTACLFDQLRVGDTVEIDGPYGLAWLREDSPRDIVCVAGGSGLAPMVSIARGAAAAGMLGSRKLHLFYGARTPRDMCGEAFLRDLPNAASAIQFHGVVSNPESGETPWSGETGFVHDAVVRHLGQELPRHEFYFAGPPPMTQALQEVLMVKHLVPYQQIHFDRFF
jgi:toluene monooxygenase electron transfer component